MPLSPDFLDHALELLSQAAPTTAKKMFGGAGLYADGILFGLLDDDRVYFKADASNAARFDAHGAGWFHPYGDERTMPYREVPIDVLEDPEELRLWIDGAVAIAVAKRSGRAEKKSATKRPAVKNPAKKPRR